jgi:hypothetical protein
MRLLDLLFGDHAPINLFDPNRRHGRPFRIGRKVSRSVIKELARGGELYAVPATGEPIERLLDSFYLGKSKYIFVKYEHWEQVVKIQAAAEKGPSGVLDALEHIRRAIR